VTPGSADTNRIERDLEHTRARLDSTLDALQQKLSPGQMVDEAMNWFREGNGAEFGRNFGRNVRDNPIPVALIGIGVGWLLIGGGRRGRDDRWEEQRHGYERGGGLAGRSYGADAGTVTSHQPLPYEAAAYDDLATKAHDAGARVERRADESDESYRERVYAAKGAVLGVTRQVGEAIAGFAERVEAAVEAAADRFRQMAHSAGGTAGRAGGRAGEVAGDAMSRGRSGLRSLYGYGQSAAYSAREGADHAASRAWDVGSRTAGYVKDQPLLMGVLGLTVGAVLGMLVPPTRYEREIAGDLRRSLGEQAREAAGEIGQRVTRVAETVLDTAHDAARREGLTGMSPSAAAADAHDRVTDTARGVRKVVEETVEAGRDAVKREATASGGDSATGASGGGNVAGGGQKPAATGAAAAGGGRGEHGDRRPVLAPAGIYA
jgi:gas vesicle protein